MRILSIEPRPFHELPYHGAASGGGPEDRVLPFLRARVEGLSAEMDAILATADLQGLESSREGGHQPQKRLLGEALADEVHALSATAAAPCAGRMGVLLGGDFACRPGADRRGGYRDVLPVWKAFSRFRWVAGVAGNHDIMGRSPRELRSFKKGTAIYFLDANVATADGLRVAGLGGVIGNPRKPYRRNESDFLNALRSLLSEKPDILILHESPEVPGRPGTGDPRIGEALREARDLLVICGHRRWEEPLVELEGGIQLLNVDERVILLMRPGV